MGDDHPTQREIKRLGELIKDIQVAMLTTVNQEGELRSRPMATQEQTFDGTLWFFTGAHGGKVDELERDQRVNLSYSDVERQRYISVSGHAQLVRDKSKMKELWSPVYRAWFPEGLDDPELALLRVQVDKAEYWESPSSPVVHLIGFSKAILTGKPYRNDKKGHEKLDFSDYHGVPI
jgi:general stress protein 26